MTHNADRPNDNPLALDPETMRRLGYQTVDMLVELVANLNDERPIRHATREEMEGRLGGGLPDEPLDFDRILEKLRIDVMPYMSRCDHPRYFAFIPSAGTWPAALGDFIASALNIFGGVWRESAGPSQLELVVLDWFKHWIGYPGAAAGVLVSGGSAANMTALACARETLVGAMTEKVVVYVSDQAHSSLARAARILGFRPDQVRVLPADDRYRMRPDALAQAIDADRRAGWQPLFVSASAGSTNTGSVDPLLEIAQVCNERGVWFHVDAAYGGFAVLTERGRQRLSGLERADSVTLDPHKWLYQPFECGCLLVRDGAKLRQAFEITPDYLHDVRGGLREVNFSDLGIQLTRMSRALKVWVSLNYFGADAFKSAIDRALDLAVIAEDRIEGSDRLELISAATLGIVCFRRRFGVDEDERLAERLNAEIVRRLEMTGMGFISSTRLRGRYALRICVLNHTTAADDVHRVLDWIERLDIGPNDVSAQAATVLEVERHPDVTRGWLRRPRADATVAQKVPLFRSLTPAQLNEVIGVAREQSVAQGETILDRWDTSRDFYVILDGSVSVQVGEEHVRDLGPGDHFGELAALDWGASFGYPRLATVVAVSPVTLLVLPSTAFNQLLRQVPDVEEQIRLRVQERLPRT